MNKYVRIVLFGVLLWLIVFAVSVVIFPLQASQRPLFESIMPVAIAVCTVMLGALLFRAVTGGFLAEGVLLGAAWLIINIAIDLPLFLPESPMQKSPGEYAADIGITYLMIPVITAGMGWVLGQKVR